MDKVDEKVAELEAAINETGMAVLTEGYTLPMAIREGATVTEHAIGGWGNGHSACALAAGYIAARARHLTNE
jgi:hypothetical protein